MRQVRPHSAELSAKLNGRFAWELDPNVARRYI